MRHLPFAKLLPHDKFELFGKVWIKSTNGDAYHYQNGERITVHPNRTVTLI
jgi:hypothetical protein